MIVTKWVRIEYDKHEEREYFLRYVIRDDGKTVEQIASKTLDDGSKTLDDGMDALKLYRQQLLKKEGIQVRHITAEEKALAIARRGRGIGVEPSTVIVTLANQHGFVASLSSDCDGGLGTVERV